ncbi:MAG: helix-turn-helix domain-containing protein [Firmicutes bacterium]|nr:helix-turn-helix domain-containing protein [Bacillota bacterium]
MANRLRLARQQSGMTQKELALRLGIHQSTLSEYEAEGGKSRPSLWMLARLARTLGVSADYLLGLESDERPSKGMAATNPIAPTVTAHVRPETASVALLQEEVLRILAVLNVLVAHLADHGMPVPWDRVGPRFRQALAQEAQRLGWVYVPDSSVADESPEAFEAFLRYRLGVGHIEGGTGAPREGAGEKEEPETEA